MLTKRQRQKIENKQNLDRGIFTVSAKFVQRCSPKPFSGRSLGKKKLNLIKRVLMQGVASLYKNFKKLGRCCGIRRN